MQEHGNFYKYIDKLIAGYFSIKVYSLLEQWGLPVWNVTEEESLSPVLVSMALRKITRCNK